MEQQRDFIKDFLEYNTAISQKFDKIETLIKELTLKYDALNIKQTVLEHENNRVAIKELSEKITDLDKRHTILFQRVDDRDRFKERVEEELKQLKTTQLSEEDLKMVKKIRNIGMFMGVVVILFQVWQFLKDLGIIKLP